MEIRHDIDNMRLTSSEIGELWTTYIYGSMSKCVLSYFLSKCNDNDIRLLIEGNLNLTVKNLEIITEIFNSVDFPIPIGFTDEDVNLNAKKLYSDTFMLHYMKHKTKFEMITHTSSLALSARSDVREFFNHCIKSKLEFCNMIDDTLLSKGLFIRSPYISTPEQVEFVKKQSFLSGFFGDKRPINTREIGYLYFNIRLCLRIMLIICYFLRELVKKFP